jgi:hypothetical protein
MSGFMAAEYQMFFSTVPETYRHSGLMNSSLGQFHEGAMRPAYHRHRLFTFV